MDPKQKGLLDFIGSIEANGNYNAYYGNANNQSVNLTGMTINEVQAYQADLARRTGSSAVGKYQFLQKTLQGLLPELGLSGDTQFTPEVQDALAVQLLKRRGYDEFASGQLTAHEFGNNLAYEWASLPMLSGEKAGMSAYQGDSMGNKALTDADAFLGMLDGNAGTNAPASNIYDYAREGAEQYRHGDPSNPVNIADVQPLTPPTIAEERAAQVELEQAEGQSLLAGIGDAISVDWTGAQVIQNHFMSAPEMAPDPNFRLSSELLDEWTKDIPEQYWDRFSGVSSEAQGQFTRKRIIETMESEKRLAEMGTTGVVLRLAAGFTDPVAWGAAVGVSALSGGVGAPAALGARFGRMGVIGAAALEGAAGTTISEGIMMANKPTYETSEALFAIGTGLVLGGALGPLSHHPEWAEASRQIEQVGRRMLKESTALTPANRSVGAAQVNVREDLRTDISEIIRDGDAVAPRPFMEQVRYDLAAMTKRSSNTLTRILGNNLFEDGARNVDDVTPIGMSEVQALYQRRMDNRWTKQAEPAWLAFSKRTGKTGDEERHVFMKSVTDYATSRDPSVDDWAPEIVKAGEAMRTNFARWQELGSNPGIIDGTIRKAVRGFEKLKENKFYVPRIFDLGSINAHLDEFGDAPLEKLVSEAMQDMVRKHGDQISQGKGMKLTAEQADRFAKGYIRRLARLSAGELNAHGLALSGDDMDGLKKLLADDTDLGDAELDAILEMLKPKDNGGAVTRGKHRALFDDDFGAKLVPKNGGPARFVRLADLMVRDADQLVTLYNRQMSGRVAMARLRVRNPNWQEGDEFDEFLIDGVTNDGDWQILMDKVRAVGAAQGQPAHKINEDIKRLQFAYDTIIGRPPLGDESSGFHQTLRMARDYNFLRVMGQVGFAQIPELANIAAQVGFKAMLNNMPSLRSLWRNAQTGKLDDALAEEIEDFTTSGTDWLRHVASRRVDDFGNPMSPFESGSFMDRVDQFNQKAKKGMTAVSGMAPVNTFLQRTASRAIMQKFAIAARKGKLKADKRMMGLGLDQEMLDRIAAQINKHATFTKGVLDDRVTAMGFSKWDDAGAIAAFEGAAFRMGRTVIQENDVGNLAMWMNHNLARTLLQFRGFMLAGWSKQLLNGLNHRDWATFTGFTLSWFVAGLTYVGRTYLQSAGQPDREAFLKERLDTNRVILNGLQNSSWFTMLGPTADTAWGITGMEAQHGDLFTGRTTGLASNWVEGNPTMDLYRKLETISKIPGQMATGGGFTQGDARALFGVMPFQNVLGITNIGAAMIGNAPTSRPD